MNTRLNITQNLAAMVTRHGKTSIYFHRFKILDLGTCACKKGDRKIDHLLYQCTLLETHREHKNKYTMYNGKWPASKQEFISKHRNSFL
jgi:hypothetical protein